jgi:hypothetical protein
MKHHSVSFRTKGCTNSIRIGQFPSNIITSLTSEIEKTFQPTRRYEAAISRRRAPGKVISLRSDLANRGVVGKLS